MAKVGRKKKDVSDKPTLSVPKSESRTRWISEEDAATARENIQDAIKQDFKALVANTKANLPEGWANQRHAMLHGFAMAGEDGYTREQAAKAAGVNLRSCWWKRAGELAEYGYIEPVKVGSIHLTRKSEMGGLQGVFRITKAGKQQLAAWGWR